jgi:hypothetical protein
MRGRRVLLLSLAVVALGVIVALGALYLDPARAAVGPMPGVGLSLPADTRMVTGLDVKRFVASPFYQRFSRARGQRPAGFAELEARTGINPERDVDQLLMSGQSQAGAAAIAIGRFDRRQVTKALGAQKNVTTKKHEGAPLYVFREGVRGASALAFLSDDAIVFGSEPQVAQTVTSHVKGSGGLRDNAELMGLLQSVRPGATFWTAGDQSLLSQMPGTVPMPGGGGGTMTLPGMKSLVVTGDLDPAVSFEALAFARDEAAARQLADVVRGLIALATLQASQKPEYQQLASALTVTNEASKVRVNGRFSYELLDKLQPPQRAIAPQASPPTH